MPEAEELFVLILTSQQNHMQINMADAAERQLKLEPQPELLSGTEGSGVISSFLIHRFPFLVLPLPVCGRRAMKNRSSSPPLHVHVDENTPVHVHIKKGQKTTPAKCQVGACSWV